MLGIKEKYDTFKESTHFVTLKAGGRFALYAFGIYLVTTFTIGCLGLIIGSPLLTLPLAMLIFHPVAWILMGAVLTLTYKTVIEPLFHLVKSHVDGKEASEEKESNAKTNELSKSPKQERAVNNQGNSKIPDGDSGIVPGSEPVSRDNSRRNSNASGDSGIDVNSAKDKQYKVVTYNTAGEMNNCFFHSVFGEKDSSGKYQTRKAQDMRMEWHKFLSQFDSLGDEKMPAALRAELRTVFNMFLDRPRDLTGKHEEIKGLAEHTKKKIEKVEKKVKKLIRRLLHIGLTENEVNNNLRELAVNNLISIRRYDRSYSSENVANSFLNGKSIYKSYLEAIKSPYQVFVEEIPILASLANIEILLYPHVLHNQGIFKPNSEMINQDYQRNDELWGDKKQETIHLTPGHYERAEVVEIEPSLMERVNSFMQDVMIAAYNSVRNAFSSN